MQLPAGSGRGAGRKAAGGVRGKGLLLWRARGFTLGSEDAVYNTAACTSLEPGEPVSSLSYRAVG